MARHTQANVKTNGKEVTVSNHDSDSPLLPVAQIQQLHEFRPDRVDWVFNQTQIEAETRRAERHRINTFTFVERLIGQIFAFCIGLAGIGGGVYAATHGAEKAGYIIAGLAISGLAAVFLTGKRGR